MSPEAQQSAMLEASGWKPGWSGIGGSAAAGYRRRQRGCNDEWEFRYADQLPDYLVDLNAIRELEEMFMGRDVAKYVEHLSMCVGDDPGGDPNVSHYMLIIASAAERCEAVLRTLGKWTDQ